MREATAPHVRRLAQLTRTGVTLGHAPPRLSGQQPFRIAIALATILLFSMVGFAQAPAVSPSVDPTHGFPLWYQDATGLRLEPCLDTKGPCVLLADPGFNPANPVVFPTNFPSEFFYTVVDADKLTTPGCPASGIAAGPLKFRAALEGSFLNGVVRAGEQITFTRTKIVANGLCPNTTYTFTHPYGTDVFTANGSGQIVANKTGGTIDIGCAVLPCDFSAALSSRVMKGFVSLQPSPIPGYLGDANGVGGTIGPITGSPSGNNFFSLADANGNILAQTTNFTVSGRIAGPLMTSPAAIDFGGQNVTTPSAPRTVTFTNVYSAPVTVTNLAIQGTNALEFAVSNDTCTNASLARDASCTVSVTFTPGAANVRTGQLAVAFNGPFGSPRLEDLTGTGTAQASAPTVSLSATALTFGSVRVRETSAIQRVTVNNTGTAPLGVTLASLINADPLLFPAAADQFKVVSDTCSGKFVSAGASCALDIAFAPTVAASSTALLSLVDNAPDTPQNVTVTGTGTGGIAAVSSTLNPYGYPDWYKDDSGLSLQPCVDPLDPLCVLLAGPGFIPAKPLVFTSNFPSEFFYVVADSDKLSTPGCSASGIGSGTVKFRAALEGAFATTLGPRAGDQITFARTKIVASGLCPNTTYAFTHPYGRDLVTTDTSGGVVANKKGATIDIGCLGAPCDFSLALSSRVFGGFVRWDPAVPPAAPPGRLGDAGAAVGTPHSIVGSPFTDPITGLPANFFRISDPITNAVIAQTNLFTVSGKIATPIVAIPARLNFAAQAVGTTSASQTVTITNIQAQTVSVSSVISTTPDYIVGTNNCASLAPNATCTIDVAFTPTSAGVLAGALSIASSTAAGPSPSLEVVLSGNGVWPTTAIASAASITFPQNATVNVTISSPNGTPSGNVSLAIDGGTPVVQPLAANGTAIFTLISPSGGQHSLTVSYASQGNFAAASTTATLTVKPGASITTMTGPAITSGADGAVTVTVRSTDGITPGSGNVTLTVDGTSQQTAPLSAGSVVFAILKPGTGSHTLRADYLGGINLLASSATGTLAVNSSTGVTTQTTITAPTISYPSNANVSVAVSATSGKPTGSVTLVMGGTKVGSQNVPNNGIVSFAISKPNAASYALVATYSPNTGFQASSANGTLTVNGAATTTNITAASIIGLSDGQVKVTVTSAAGALTGSVNLLIGNLTLMTQPLTAGSSTFTITAPAVGTHTLLATYTAQGNFAASSVSGSLVVNAAASQATITKATANIGGKAPNQTASWSVSGTAQAVAGNFVTITLVRTGAIIAPNVAVNAKGEWKFSVTTSTLPVTGDTIMATPSNGTPASAPFAVTVK